MRDLQALRLPIVLCIGLSRTTLECWVCKAIAGPMQSDQSSDRASEGSGAAPIAVPDETVQALKRHSRALFQARRYAEALACCDEIIVLEPDDPGVLNRRGMALERLQRLEEALETYDRVLALRPQYAAALFNRGTVLTELKRLDEAIANFDAGLTLEPNDANAFLHRSIAKLLAGRFAEGWRDYEWRWKAKAASLERRSTKAPEWKGEDIAGRRIVVFAEQGLGDAIQFSRYLPLLGEREAVVTFMVTPKLHRLLRRLSPGLELVASVGARDFDVQCPLMSLPLRFGTDERSIPSAAQYLKSEKDLRARWRRVIGRPGFKIGIVWQGRPNTAMDRGRSIPLAEFVPLARIPGVRLISLQKSDGLDQLDRLPSDVAVETLGRDFDSGPDAFIDCAAVMSNLDLIITSDTASAHLAGALGRPVWLALKHVPDWRWLLDRDDSPWYPTMRLFRQQSNGDWRTLFSNIERELRSLLRGR